MNSEPHQNDRGNRQTGRPDAAETRIDTAEVRRVATLARLRLTDEDARAMRDDLAAVLRHAERLLALDVSGVEPMARVAGSTGGGSEPADANRWRADKPAEGLDHAALRRMAPDLVGPFIAVPRVLGDGTEKPSAAGGGSS